MYYHFFPFNRLFFLLLAFATLFCWQCRKAENSTIIKGRVVAYGTNEPIAGARIYLLCYSGQIFGPTSSSFVDSLVTDDNGAFFAEFAQGELCGSIYLSAFKEGYHFKRDIDIVTGVNDLEIILDPFAWLKVMTIPDITGNMISFTGTFTGAAGWTTGGSEGTKEYLFETQGNRQHLIRWSYWSTPPVTSTEDSVYLMEHDTLVYMLHY